jgi:hypothetical protein
MRTALCRVASVAMALFVAGFLPVPSFPHAGTFNGTTQSNQAGSRSFFLHLLP